MHLATLFLFCHQCHLYTPWLADIFLSPYLCKSILTLYMHVYLYTVLMSLVIVTNVFIWQPCLFFHIYDHLFIERPTARKYILYVYMYAYICMHIYTYIHSCSSAYIYTSMYTYIHMYIHTCLPTCINTDSCLYAYKHAYIHVYTHACLSTYINTHIYACTYKYIIILLPTYILQIHIGIYRLMYLCLDTYIWILTSIHMYIQTYIYDTCVDFLFCWLTIDLWWICLNTEICWLFRRAFI